MRVLRTVCSRGLHINYANYFHKAGLSLDKVSGTQTSCYIGTFTADFPNMQARDNEGPSIYRESSTPSEHLKRGFT
jgi:hypothetical protein